MFSSHGGHLTNAMLHIKFKRITNSATWYQIFCPQIPLPHPTLGMRSIGQNSFFSDMVMLSIKLNSITKYTNMVANILSAYLNPPHPTLGSKGQNSTFSKYGYVAYIIKWNHEMKQHRSKYFGHGSPPN